MQMLVIGGPVIGAVILAIYVVGLKVHMNISQNDKVSKKQKMIYYILIALELLCVLMSILIPRITGESYLIDGMSSHAKYTISDTTFKVEYKESKRNYSNRINVTSEELMNIHSICEVGEGKVFLRISQGDVVKEIEITNKDILLDMSEYKEGDIRFTLVNENAKDVKFELQW